MAAVPAFGDLAKSTKELLWTGSRGEGVFQFDQRASLETRTADGVVFTATTVRKDDTVENALKAAYKTGRVGLAATLGAGGALSATASVADVAPGLAVSLTGALPDIAAAKLGLDYLRPHLTAKATVGLSATPKVELSATSGVRDVAFGVSGAYDAAKGAVSAWSAGASLTRPDFQASAVLLDLGKTVKLGYAHNVDAATVAGAEVTRALDGGAETVFAVGYGKRLPSGALAKVRAESTGLTSLLYEQELSPLSRLALCSQFDATNLDKPPKVGVNIALKN